MRRFLLTALAIALCARLAVRLVSARQDEDRTPLASASFFAPSQTATPPRLTATPARVDNPNVTAPPPPPAPHVLPERSRDPLATVWPADPSALRSAVASTGVAACLADGRGSVVFVTAPMDGVDRVVDGSSEGADADCIRRHLASLHFEESGGEAHHSVPVP